MNLYTFEELSVMTNEDLERIKQEKADELAAARQRRWTKIVTILFYQREIEKEDRS